jgi:nitroreductase
MKALEALRTRRSVRRYQDRPVAPEVLEQIVDAGRLAATARNGQPWEFVVLTDHDLKAQVAAATDHGKFIADGPAAIAVFCQESKYYLEDGAAATQNILVAAHSLGLGACWIAGDKKEYAPAIGKLLGAPQQMRLVSLVALGYPQDQLPEKEKRPLSAVLHWEHF